MFGKVKMILFYYCLSFSIITLLTMILMNWIPISHPIGWSLPLYLLVFGFIYKIPYLTVAGFFVCMFMFLTAFLIKNKRIVLPAVLFLRTLSQGKYLPFIAIYTPGGSVCTKARALPRLKSPSELPKA